ncbi:hypothetical protein ABT218_35045 [Streptomyces sp. NPDC001455]|uniref:hypothetical protein n=1 Tax=unclassified Streptomyces TaxID=2593676 RepID=UPI0033165049
MRAGYNGSASSFQRVRARRTPARGTPSSAAMSSTCCSSPSLRRVMMTTSDASNREQAAAVSGFVLVFWRFDPL